MRWSISIPRAAAVLWLVAQGLGACKPTGPGARDGGAAAGDGGSAPGAGGSGAAIGGSGPGGDGGGGAGGGATDGPTISVGGGTLKLQVCAPDIIRAMYAKDPAFFARSTLATAPRACAPVSFDTATAGGTTTLTTTALKVLIDTATGVVTFQDLAG